jgi:hypothetical protein
MAVLVLAGSLREANAYARAKGIRIRYATGPEVVHAAKTIVELPSFRKRRDRHAMLQALNNVLKYDRKGGVEYFLDETWELPKPVYIIPAEDDAQARRDNLVDVANRAVEALAADLGITPEELIQRVAADFDAVKDVTPEQDELPIPDLPPVPESEPAQEVEPPKVEPQPLPKKASATRKRTAKKAAATPPPVVDAPVEF